MKNKNFVTATLLSTLVFIVLLGIFNILFDSFGLFTTRTELAVAAKSVAEGKMIAGLSDYDERLFQKMVFSNFKHYPDVLVIGSSRSMLVEAHMLTDISPALKVFNHSVSGASLEDYMAITAMYAKAKHLPKRIIIGIDPWVFNKNNQQGRWRSLETEFKYMAGIISGLHNDDDDRQDATQNKFQQLLNYEITKANVTALFNKDKIRVIDSDQIDEIIKRSDGSIAYPFKRRFQAEAKTLALARNDTNGPSYSQEGYTKLSNTILFENFINYLLSQGVTVQFFLPPYHPIVYSYLSNNQKYEMMNTAEKYIKNFAIKRKIKVCGSYDPSIFGFTNEDFTDGMHGKKIVAEKILSGCASK